MTAGDPLSLAAASNQFALELYSLLRDGATNVVFSPASVHLALGMALAGARSSTAEQIAAVLHATSDHAALHAAHRAQLERWRQIESCELAVANRMFAERSLGARPEFSADLETLYMADCEALDFANEPRASARQVNAWVAEATRGHIEGVMSERGASPGMLMVLMNAIYFKGEWASKFIADLTMSMPFTLSTGEQVPANTMSTIREARLSIDEDVMVLELDYVKEELCMDVILPSESKPLEEIESQLTLERLRKWLDALEHRMVRIELPRFKVDPAMPTQLNGMLTTLGMTDAFDASRAAFPAITEQPAYLQDVTHKTYIDVTEEGTEAAAITGVLFPQSAPPRDTVVFSARRPFLFCIRDRATNVMLFLGRVGNPSG